MRESSDTCSKCTSYICIDQSHLCCFIVVFIVHVVNHVQCIYIQFRQPFHHLVIFVHYFIIVKVLWCDWAVFWSNLCFCLLINTTVDCVKQTFCKVCTCSKELDLFSCLCCRYAAADRIVISPYRTHYIIVLVLYRTCLDRNIRRIFLEVLWQIRRI